MIDNFETITTSVAEALNRQDAEGIAILYIEDARVLSPDAAPGRGPTRPLLRCSMRHSPRRSIDPVRDSLNTAKRNLLIEAGRYVMGITASGQSFDDTGKFVSTHDTGRWSTHRGYLFQPGMPADCLTSGA